MVSGLVKAGKAVNGTHVLLGPDKAKCNNIIIINRIQISYN